MPERAGTPWTTFEIEAVVADYGDMLSAELVGERVIKAERRRALQQIIGRSHGSIEYKHQNISAVLELFGLPYIRGYKPARNYQRALAEAVEAQIVEGWLLRQLAAKPPKIAAPPEGLVFEPPPPRSDQPSPDDPVIGRMLRKHDPAERDRRARALGDAGELFLYEAERNRLSALGRDDLAGQVRWVAKEDGDGAGYDILSFSRDGAERWLEVKTTNGPQATPFWLTENERRVSEERPDVFRIARLYDFSRAPAAYRIRPPLEHHVRLTPASYRAGF